MLSKLKDQYGNELNVQFITTGLAFNNYLAYIKCVIDNSEDETISEGFSIAYVYQGREYSDNKNYWIHNIPENPPVETYNIAVGTHLQFNFRINMFGGFLLDSHALGKVIKLRIYNITGTKQLVWESSDIKLVSQPINTPAVTTTTEFKNGTLTIRHAFAWYSDQDFNYYDDDFHVVTELLDALGQTKRSDTRMIGNAEEVITFSLINPGKFVLLTKLYVFSGYTMYSNAEIKQLAEKYPKAYVIHDDKIYESLNIYVKVGTTLAGDPIIKQVDTLSVMDVIPKESV